MDEPQWLTDAKADINRTYRRNLRMLLINMVCVILALAAVSSIPLWVD